MIMRGKIDAPHNCTTPTSAGPIVAGGQRRVRVSAPARVMDARSRVPSWKWSGGSPRAAEKTFGMQLVHSAGPKGLKLRRRRTMCAASRSEVVISLRWAKRPSASLVLTALSDAAGHGRLACSSLYGLGAASNGGQWWAMAGDGGQWRCSKEFSTVACSLWRVGAW